jgi:hypothetical protein
MGEVHVNMNITLDGVIQANGGPSRRYPVEAFLFPS